MEPLAVAFKEAAAVLAVPVRGAEWKPDDPKADGGTDSSGEIFIAKE